MRPHLILIHGSFHGPWCWAQVAPALAAAGYAVTLPDLAEADAPQDLDAYAALVERAVDGISGPVVVIGHSMGGIVTSQLSERRSDRIAAAIYVAGLLLGDGETLMSFLDAHRELGIEDLVLKAMQIDPSGKTATFPAAAAPSIFYNECAADDAAWASRQLRPQPLAVYASPLRLSPEHYGGVPRYYIAAQCDRAVSPAYQQIMTMRTPCEEVMTLDSDHSPFLSRTDEFIEVLLRILARLVL